MVDRIFKRRIHFRKTAHTSRNAFTYRDIYIIEFSDIDGGIGYGECAPLTGLSIDDVADYEEQLIRFAIQWNAGQDPDLSAFPSVRFGFETALLDAVNGGERKLFDQQFTSGVPIPINGLVWMADRETMYREAVEKAGAGFRCLKFKVGALDFESEIALLERIRNLYSADQIELRLDANGAFSVEEALDKLERLAQFDIHSIEQPIKAGQARAMRHLCEHSPIPIALDEELIGVSVYTDGFELLEMIRPAYIILKPNLIGGYRVSDAWVDLVGQAGIGWWATSALESNIGLNGIAQWAATHKDLMLQGLGTGSLYTDNLEGPLQETPGFLNYRTDVRWAYDGFLEGAELIADLSQFSV
ncbi:MAG: o-succinylbenzoate synthase [Flavobacteriales bacterium]|nr:o-succinylbenzoate synthase [Flavobacteriales bacterium]